MGNEYDPQTRAARIELEAKLPKGIAIDVGALFPRLEGWGVAKQNLRRTQLLVRLAPVLKAALRPNETVLYAAATIVNFWWEQLFMGVWAQVINRTALVVTTERLLFVHLHGKEPGSYANQVPRAAVKKVSTGLFSTVLKLATGKVTLSGVPGPDKKALKALIVPNGQGKGGLEHLCPCCFAVHPKHVESCMPCGTHFKSPRTAALRSLLLPGLGDYYLGHRGLAALEMLGSLVTWMVVIMLVAGTIPDVDRATGLLVALAVLALANGSDAALTHAQGKKGLMSLDGTLPAVRGMRGGVPRGQEARPLG